MSPINIQKPDFDWYEPYDNPEMSIRDHNGEVDIEIHSVKWGPDWWARWVIDDNGDTYDSGYQFTSHGQALDDALEFIRDVIINGDLKDIQWDGNNILG